MLSTQHRVAGITHARSIKLRAIFGRFGGNSGELLQIATSFDHGLHDAAHGHLYPGAREHAGKFIDD